MDKKFEEAEHQIDKLAQMEKRLEMMYKRIDQLDTMVSTLIERVTAGCPVQTFLDYLYCR
jgi:hypothetical protein